MGFNQILIELVALNYFSKSTLRPNRILLNISELKSFDLLLSDDEEKSLDEQLFLVNESIIAKFYDVKPKVLLNILKSYFLKTY